MATTKPILYDQQFYDDLKGLALRSAKQIVPRILQLIDCSSVVDVGCGTGEWLSVFAEAGATEILGIDGDYVDRSMLCIPYEEFLKFDLSQPLYLDRRFDLAISLEVAEHLPVECAITFVDSLTKFSDVVLFSASIPFQDGIGHINEQWPDYWVELFRRKEFIAIDVLRQEFWENSDVAWWYKQNLMLFVQESELERNSRLSEIRKEMKNPSMRLVHPDIYLYHVRKAQQYKQIVDKKPVQALLTVRECLRSLNVFFRQ